MSDNEKNEVKTSNVQACLIKLRDMIKTLPSKEGEDVNWEELLQNKEKAEKALNQLFIMFSAEPTDVKLVGCIWLEPAI